MRRYGYGNICRRCIFLLRSASKSDLSVLLWSVPCGITAYGCCPNGVDPAFGPNYDGCEEPESPAAAACASSDHGCCLDGISTATGPDFTGCPSTVSSNQSESGCSDSAYGCCEDGLTPAYGPHSSGCPGRIKHGGNSSVAVGSSRLPC